MMQLINQFAGAVIVRLEKYGGFKLYALTLLVVMFLAYNAQFWRMGFYYDDWEGIFLYKQNFSFLQIWQYFLSDRPFSALVHVAYNPFFGASPIAWRFFATFLNWAAVLILVKTFLTIWPRHTLHIAWIGMLLVVYPGISRLFVPKTSMPHYTSLFLFVLSVYLMVLALKQERYRIPLTALSVLLGCLQVLIIEYFSGLELARFFIIYYLVHQQGGSFARTLRRSVLTFLPYLLPFQLFVYYKIFLLPAWQPEGEAAKHSLRLLAEFGANPMTALQTYLNRILQDVYYAIFYIWTRPFDPEEIDIAARATLFSWLLGASTALLAAFSIEAWVRRAGDTNAVHSPLAVRVVPLIALASMLVGGIPVWMIGRQAMYGTWADRFFFGLFIGAVALVVILALWFTRREARTVQHLALAILLAGSFAMQFRIGNKYALNWDRQRDFFWQLKWRAPSLAENTFIASPESPVAYNVNHQMAFSINMIYNLGAPTEHVRHWWYSSSEHLPAYIERIPNSRDPVNLEFRNISYEADMTYALPVIYRLSIACLLVADPIYERSPLMHQSERNIFLNSNPELILEDDIPMPVDVFGKEPPRRWCYYFQKADLARQYQRWSDVLSLWQEAEQNGYRPAYGPEYLPFIEASARLGDWNSARQFTRRALETTDNMQAVLCSNWERLMATTEASSESVQAWELMQSQIPCQDDSP